MQNASAGPILEDFFDSLRVAPSSVLMLDYDGTLAPFQLERDRAYPYPEAVSILEGIVQLGKTRVAIITGRPLGDIKRLLGPLNNIEIWGSHGLERMLPDGSYRQMNMSKETTDILSRAEEWVTAVGLTSRAEIKPGGIAIHWRGMSDAKMADIEACIREGWTALAERPEFKLLQFDGGLELRVAHPDKGDAAAAILADSDPAAQIAYLGDDFTDEDAFRVLSGCGLTVLVRTEYRKTIARAWLKPPQELISFLDQWLNRISV